MGGLNDDGSRRRWRDHNHGLWRRGTLNRLGRRPPNRYTKPTDTMSMSPLLPMASFQQYPLGQLDGASELCSFN